MPTASTVRCGPAGWTYAHWNSVVYPRPKPRGFHSLEYLSQYFDAVEIDISFRRQVKPELARLWLAKVAKNPSFRFTAVLGRRFTYERVLAAAEADAFRWGLRPMLEAGRLGCVLMQFPWSFRFTEENRDFLIRLRRAFREFPLAAELRHSSWMRDEALGTLIDYHVGFCNIDQPRHTRAMPPTALLTSAVGYVRLHGRNDDNWFRDFDERGEGGALRDHLYSEAELGEWKGRIEHVRQYAAETYVITTNSARGSSVVNALQLQAILGGVPRTLPRELARDYRGEMEDCDGERSTQNPLFAGLAVA